MACHDSVIDKCDTGERPKSHRNSRHAGVAASPPTVTDYISVSEKRIVMMCCGLLIGCIPIADSDFRVLSAMTLKA